jgi:hypothetical protein
MEIAGIAYYALAIGCAIHALRQGHGFIWVFVIFLIPPFGLLIYLLVVVLPEIWGSRAANQSAKAVRKALDPGKQLRELKQAVEISDTVVNRIALAREYAKQKMPREAIELFERSLTGMYSTDPEMLTGLAGALVQAGDFRRAKETLDTLYTHNPEVSDAETRLLYARCLEDSGETAKALDAYAEAVKSFAGAEAKYRYAALLKRQGQAEQARNLFEEIVRDSKAASRHSLELNREWLALARKEVG